MVENRAYNLFRNILMNFDIQKTILLFSKLLVYSIPLLISIYSKNLGILIFGLACNCILFYITSKYSEIKKIYILILLFQMIFMLLIYFGEFYQYGIPYFNGGSDDLTYEINAQQLVELKVYSINQAKDLVLGEHHNSPGYPIFLSYIIRIMSCFGEYNTFIPRLLNIYLFIISLVILEHISEILLNFNKLKKSYLSIVLGFFPTIAYINSHIFRDTLLFLLVISSFFIMLKLFDIKNKVHRYGITFILLSCLASIYVLRQIMLIFIIPILIILIIWKQKTTVNKLKEYLFKNKNKNILYLIIAIFMISIAIPFLYNILQKFIIYYTTYNQIILENNADGFSSIIFSAKLLPFGVILRTLYGIVTPFPDIYAILNLLKEFNLFDLVMTFLSVGTIIQIYMASFIVTKKNIKSTVFIIFVIFYMVYILTTFTFRHLIFVYPFMFMLTIQTFTNQNKKQNIKYISLVTILIILFSACYLLIKLV